MRKQGDQYLNLVKIHHVAIIVSDYQRSKLFYTETLGFKIIAENYRAAKKSYKLDLVLPHGDRLELFSFEDAPPRPSFPEALGLRHLAFEVQNLGATVDYLKLKGITPEIIRTDEYTLKKFTFIQDPDGLPIELYEAGTSNPV